MRLSQHAVDAAAVVAAEKKQIEARRAAVAKDAPGGTVGLAFSGGGIRSATLNLGILQGLAARGLLPYFDYLSTVSGGGYIGGWLHGVIQRYGKGDPREVEKLLPRPDQRPPLDSEDDPIAFLRKFSSYLAPDVGLFSADAWVIAMTWLRNMALNLTILFPFAAAITLVLIEAGWFESALMHAHPQGTATAAFAGLLFLFLALEYLGGFIDCHVARNGSKAVAWLLLILFAAISAAATAAMISCAMAWIQSWTAVPGEGQWLRLAFGPAVMIVVFLAGEGLMIGLMGVDFPDFGREWLSRIGAFLAIGAFAWAGLYAVMIFGPYWMARLTQKVAAAIASGWLLTTLGGVLAGNSAFAGGETRGAGPKALDALARISPPVFMIGFLMLASGVVHAGLAALSGGGGYWDALAPGYVPPALLAAAIAVMMFMQWRVNVNEFSMAHFYKNRLVRCYLGASRGRKRRGSRLTGFDPCDDLEISALRATPQCDRARPYFGPYAIVNTSINLNSGSEMARRERRASSFVFTPLYSGYDPPRQAEEVAYGEPEDRPLKGYRPTYGYGEPAGPRIGSCMAISGAAVNPDMGFHTSAPVAFLLTVFDVRLGWWAGNTRFDRPSARPGPRFALLPLLSELFGQTDARSQFVNLSDGGHFENLGLYELVRRRCRYIIVGEGDEDSEYEFESLGGAVRKCRADFGVEIQIDARRLRPHGEWSLAHFAVGRILYPDAEPGWLLYLKSSMTGDEPADVMQYKASNAAFPQETTANQFFTESQFESYRRLGRHMVDAVFEKTGVPESKSDPEWLEKLFRSL